MAISVASSFFNAADSENEILKRSAEARPDAKNATISTYMFSLNPAFRHAVNSWSPTRATHVSPQEFVVPRPRLATNSPTSSFDVTSHTPVRTRQNRVHVLVGRARSLTGRSRACTETHTPPCLEREMGGSSAVRLAVAVGDEGAGDAPRRYCFPTFPTRWTTRRCRPAEISPAFVPTDRRRRTHGRATSVCAARPADSMNARALPGDWPRGPSEVGTTSVTDMSSPSPSLYPPPSSSSSSSSSSLFFFLAKRCNGLSPTFATIKK